jgi:hypothetical protein
MLALLLSLSAACAGPASATSASGPGEKLAELFEWFTDRQQERADPPQAVAQAPATGPTLSLDRLDDPSSIERSLRELLERRGELRLTVPHGRAWMGDFGLGTGDTLRGHLLVLRGTARIFGRLEGNVVALDGDIVVHRGGSVTGDALAISGKVRDADRAIEGEVRALSQVEQPVARVGPVSTLRRVAGLAGVFLITGLIGFGLVTFAKPSLETVSDTVRHSLGRAFMVGLLAQVLVIPTFGMLVVGLALTVVGVLLIPFAVVTYVLLVLAALVLGIVAMAHAMGEAYTRRRMALGVVLSPNSYRYVLVGLAGLLALWAVWAVFGWVPLAGSLVFVGAALVTWLLATVGFGASLLSRAGVRPDFAGRIIPSEALTDEYLWATPQLGVPAVKRPTPPPRS